MKNSLVLRRFQHCDCDALLLWMMHPKSSAKHVSMIECGLLASAAVPTFTAAIAETLQSTSQRTCRIFEIIVVGDGSTDDTGEIARRHRLTDPQCRVFSTHNSDVGSSRNEGIRASAGALVAFKDVIGLWHATRIEKQLGALLSAGRVTALAYSPFHRPPDAGAAFASGLEVPYP